MILIRQLFLFCTQTIRKEMSSFRLFGWFSTPYSRLFLLIFLLGLLLRVLLPDLKLFHHDEAIHAWYSYNLITLGEYQYDPAYHGPLLYYLTGIVFLLFQDSDLTARLLPAVFGTAVIPLFWFLFREGWLSLTHALFAGLFYAVSPSMVYFSRFLRHDIFQLFFTALLLVSLLVYLDRSDRRFALLAAISAACGLCLKEDMPFTLLIIFSFFLFTIACGYFPVPGSWRRDLTLGLLVMAGIGGACYTTFLLHPEMVLKAPVLAIEHWMGVQGACRICGESWYYLMLLVVYELPLLILGGVGVFWWGVRNGTCGVLISRMKRGKEGDLRGMGRMTGPVRELDRSIGKEDLLILFCLYWALSSLILYAVIGEKVPWLLIHQLFPIIILAAAGLTGKKAGVGILCSILLLAMTLHLCYTPGDLNEPIVQAQNSEDMREVMSMMGSSNLTVVLTDAYWPLPWYFRGDAWQKIALLAGKPDPSLILENHPDLVVLPSGNSYAPEMLPGYRKQEYVYNYSFSLPLVSDHLPGWYLMRDGERLTTVIDVFSRDTPSPPSILS